MAEKKNVLQRLNVVKKIENFFKKKVGGGFLWKEAERLFDYKEASLRCYKVFTSLTRQFN